ncbi:hypothetical protein BB561_003089 [Smittium simulii]|uniref:Maleylacetoacetate isomerase n=1 Tax=Smittium simulii TaxID=133385 RepID=A0A2T9YMY4_9FUNG|nr:hypothetical protein BB561_003089 [Smittium simulii]
MSDSTSKVVLYSYFRSTCSARVRIALNYKRIQYTQTHINLLEKKNKTCEYANKSPTQFVPLLEIDGLDLIESAAILEYLEETRPEPALLPKEPAQRAKVRVIMSIIGCGIQPLQNNSQLALYPAEARAERAATVIRNGFSGLEKYLSKVSGLYSVGSQLSIADVYLYPMCHAAQRYNVQIEDYPTIFRIFHELSLLEPFINGAWFMQEDCPDELKQA